METVAIRLECRPKFFTKPVLSYITKLVFPIKLSELYKESILSQLAFKLNTYSIHM